jgi:hypothetical protein
MEQNTHYEILVAIAERIVSELFAKAKRDPQIMVCDWRAYAIRQAFREYSNLIDQINVPEIEECFSGSVFIPELLLMEEWKALSVWHEIHSDRYHNGYGEHTYGHYLDMETLKLEHYVLTLY